MQEVPEWSERCAQHNRWMSLNGLHEISAPSLTKKLLPSPPARAKAALDLVKSRPPGRMKIGWV